MQATKMTREQLTKAARNYDNLQSEGGEGYNPYRDELERREDEATPMSLSQREHQILQKLATIDCSIARESDPDNAAKVAKLREELDANRQAQQDEFTAEWTLEVTQARRKEWNDRVDSGQFGSPGNVDSTEYYRQQHEQGWTLSNLKKAITRHGL